MDCDAEAELVRMRLTDMGGIDRIAIELPKREAVVEHRTDTGLIDAALQDLGLGAVHVGDGGVYLLYTSPSPRDLSTSRMPSSA